MELILELGLRIVRLQIFRFGIIGVAATVIHSGVVVSLVELGGLSPTPANLLAFGCALGASYVGHYYWTFRAISPHATAFVRFAIAAATGLVLNYALFFAIVDMWRANYLIALCAVLVVVPAVTFTMNKLWAFR